MSFYVETKALGKDGRIIMPFGTVDNASFEILELVLKRAYADGVIKIAIDLANVPRISSVGIGVLISCQTHLAAKRGGKLVILSPREDVLRIFEVMDYLDVFDIVASLTEAEDALHSD